MKNSTKPPFKRSQIERMMNSQILILFAILFVLSAFSSIASLIWSSGNNENHWYLGPVDVEDDNIGFSFLTFILLYNNLIPISLQVTLEFVKFFQAFFINWVRSKKVQELYKKNYYEIGFFFKDKEMYDEENDFYALARTSNLNEELGQIKYIFSDKTGTLTKNQMELKKCSIAGKIYTQKDYGPMLDVLRNEDRVSEYMSEYLTILATCHTVMPEKKEDGEISYQASSPDESAFVSEACKMGIVFTDRSPDRIKIRFVSQMLLS